MHAHVHACNVMDVIWIDTRYNCIVKISAGVKNSESDALLLLQTMTKD